MSQQVPKSQFSDYQYIAAYSTMIVLMYMFAKTKFGYTFMYYILALFAFTLFLLNAGWLAKVLAPIGGPNANP